MKKIYFGFCMVLVALISSCSSGNIKEITPNGVDFTSGELGSYLEVVNEPAELSMVEDNDAVIPSQTFILKVKLKLKKECKKVKGLDIQDVDFTRLLSVATIKLQDENGADVQDVSFKYDEKAKLVKLLQSSPGSTETIIFEGKFNNSEDAPKWFEKAVKFTPYLSADISTKKMAEDDDELEEADEPAPLNKEVDLEGKISSYPVVMHLEFNDGMVTGNYYYKSVGPSQDLRLMGTIDEYGNIDIHENAPDGTPSGHFTGRFDDGVLDGEFVNYRQEHMSFHLVAKNGASRAHSSSSHYSYDYDDDDYDYDEDDYDDDDYEANTGGRTSALGKQALYDIEAFVKKIERMNSITESEAQRLSDEFEAISNKYKRLDDSDFSAADLKKLEELERRFDRAEERLSFD